MAFSTPSHLSVLHPPLTPISDLDQSTVAASRAGGDDVAASWQKKHGLPGIDGAVLISPTPRNSGTISFQWGNPPFRLYLTYNITTGHADGYLYFDYWPTPLTFLVALQGNLNLGVSGNFNQDVAVGSATLTRRGTSIYLFINAQTIGGNFNQEYRVYTLYSFSFEPAESQDDQAASDAKSNQVAAPAAVKAPAAGIPGIDSAFLEQIRAISAVLKVSFLSFVHPDHT
ncbi:hypothetical protein SISNIDRAFT_487090 [Sistotremastrum niveocremeum HHB9708]|uniref:Uncharacterized protein n=1 Tax=Sistotremastrum niveocremeum HHB9708 TaxID=1314777 RepID=A0A164SSX2_9AGAM|nr:hypothetical protein SISNIDRAFT_487090 [Sistotremastrum niveocremeum HHB9708]